MNIDRRKQLQAEYKNRKPEMGIIAFTCKQTGESFLCACRDVNAGFNRSRLQLNITRHPNAKLQALWTQFGESGFELSVKEALPYEQADEVSEEDLETLLELCLARDNQSLRM